jgi:hypothetical protein
VTATEGLPQPGRPSVVARLLPVGAVVAVVLAGVALVASTVSDDPSRLPPSVRPEMPVTAMHRNAMPANNTPMLVADPADPNFVVLANRLDAPDFSCALHLSGDGGRTWAPAQPVPELPPGAEKCYGPEVAFDAAGVLYYLFVGLHGAGNEPMGAFLTTSADRGRSFSAPRQVLGPLNFGVRMGIDPTTGDKGRLHLVWLHATSDPPLGGFGPPPNPILAAFSDDGGLTFSEPVPVSDPSRQRVAAPALALGPDHAVHVGYYDLQDDARDYQGLEGSPWEGTWSLVLASSTDGGGHFRSRIVDDEIVPHERVMLIFTMPPPALVAGDGRLCAAWTDARHGDADVLLRCSGDGGQRWQELRRVNDDPLGNERTQYLPHLSLSPGGRLDAVFYDRRDDSEDLLNDVSFTYSTDGGGSFAPNLRLTSDPSLSLIGQEYAIVSAEGLVEFGSRLALLSRPEAAVAAWADTRNSLPTTTGQDVFATQVDLPLAGDSLDRRRLLGGGLLVVGVLAGIGLALRLRSWRAPQAGIE